MEFIDEDKILIKNLHDSNRARRQKKLMIEFPGKGGNKSGLSCSVVSTKDISIVRMN